MIVVNRSESLGAGLYLEDAEALGVRGAMAVEQLLSLCPVHAPTPLLSLSSLADVLGIAALAVKDESQRLGLGSFKALGGASIVIRRVLLRASARLGYAVEATDLLEDHILAAVSDLVVTCASAGNHGRAVAAGASVVGCRAVIFVHTGVSADRVAAIARCGAEIRQVDGVYDDAVTTARSIAAQEHWDLVSDTASPGYEHIPLQIMQGYTVALREALAQLSAPPTHVFVQAGVGGLAAAVAAYLRSAFGTSAPRLVVVEPARAACLFASHQSGKLTKIAREGPTLMAMLECYEPSLVAWRILERTAHAFMTVDEEDAVSAMLMFAHPVSRDPRIAAGESGGVGLAALRKALTEPRVREALELDHRSRVLLFNTEGPVDLAVHCNRAGGSSSGDNGLWPQ